MSVRGYSCGDSVLLFVPWDPGSLCKCKYASATLLCHITFSLVPVIITDGHASSDWSPGPMLVGVHLGVICVMIGSSLMFLVFFVYVFDKEKFVHICFITTERVEGAE